LDKLSGEWVTALDDLAEGRIAAALAGMWQPELGAFREHLQGSSRRFSWTGRNLAERMAATLERRVVAAESEAMAEKAMRSSRLARNTDAMAFLEGSIDDELTEDLLFALTLVDWRKAPAGARAPKGAMFVWPVYGLLKHVFLGRPVPHTDGVVIAPDLNVIAALRSGDVARAAELAARRLRIAGLAPPELEYAGGFDGTRLAAALLIPVPYSAELRNLVRQEKNDDRLDEAE
jgi:CRISPR-associated protein Csx17